MNKNMLTNTSRPHAQSIWDFSIDRWICILVSVHDLVFVNAFHTCISNYANTAAFKPPLSIFTDLDIECVENMIP